MLAQPPALPKLLQLVACLNILTEVAPGFHLHGPPRPLACPMARVQPGRGPSKLVRELDGVDAHVQQRWLHVACWRRAAVHDAGGDNGGDRHSVDAGKAEARFQRGWPDDASRERRVGCVAVRVWRTSVRLHELQAQVLGLHVGRTA